MLSFLPLSLPLRLVFHTVKKCSCIYSFTFLLMLPPALVSALVVLHLIYLTAAMFLLVVKYLQDSLLCLCLSVAILLLCFLLLLHQPQQASFSCSTFVSISLAIFICPFGAQLAHIFFTFPCLFFYFFIYLMCSILSGQLVPLICIASVLVLLIKHNICPLIKLLHFFLLPLLLWPFNEELT